MEVDHKFRCRGVWDGKKFDRVIEAEDESDAHLHWMCWAAIAGINLENLHVEKMAA